MLGFYNDSGLSRHIQLLVGHLPKTDVACSVSICALTESLRQSEHLNGFSD